MRLFLCGFGLDSVVSAEVCHLRAELSGFLEREHECAHVVHLALMLLVAAHLFVILGLLVECLEEFAVHVEACLAVVAVYADVRFLTGVGAEREAVEVTVA